MAQVIGTRRRSERGNALIEMALLLPLLIAVILGIIDSAFLLQRYLVVSNAAREGARIGLLPDYAESDAQARVLSYLASGGLTGSPTVNNVRTATVSVGGETMREVIVEVSYPHDFMFVGPIFALFGGSVSPFTLTARSAMRMEMQAP